MKNRNWKLVFAYLLLCTQFCVADSSIVPGQAYSNFQAYEAVDHQIEDFFLNLSQRPCRPGGCYSCSWCPIVPGVEIKCGGGTPFSFTSAYGYTKFRRHPRNNEDGFKTNYKHFTQFVNINPCGCFHFGGIFSYLDYKNRFYENKGSMSYTDFIPGAYLFFKTKCGFFLGLSGKYAVSKTDNYTRFDGTSDVTGEVHGRTISSNALVGLDFSHCHLHFTPIVAATYNYLEIDKYTERDTETPLTYQDQYVQSLIAKGGLQVYTCLCFRPFVFTPRAWVFYQNERFNNKRQIRTFDSNGDPTPPDANTTDNFILTQTPKHDLIYAGAGFDLNFCNWVRLSFQYEQSFMNTQKRFNTVKGSLTIAF